MSDAATFYSLFLCTLVPINEVTTFELYSGNVNKKCTDKRPGALSYYKVVLGAFTRSYFLIQVFKENKLILGAICSVLSGIISLEQFVGRGSVENKQSSQEGDIIGLITITEKINVDNILYHYEFSYEFIINPLAQVPQVTYAAKNIKLEISLQGSNNINSNSPSLLNSINKKLNNSNLNVYIQVQTDIIGLNLGEMYCRIDTNKRYPNGYPQKYRGVCVGFEQPKNSEIKPTFYSFKPNIQKVLKLSGNLLYEQSKNINNKYDTGLLDCEFYGSILAYSTLRYIFAGLSNNSVFSTKWLCSNNYDKFLTNLQNSEFSEAVFLFTEPQEEFDFSDFNKYYKKCKCQK